MVDASDRDDMYVATRLPGALVCSSRVLSNCVLGRLRDNSPFLNQEKFVDFVGVFSGTNSFLTNFHGH